MVIDYLSYEEKKLDSQKLGSQKLGPQSPSLRLGAAVDTDRYHHGHHVILTHRKVLYRQKSDKTNALAQRWSEKPLRMEGKAAADNSVHMLYCCMMGNAKRDNSRRRQTMAAQNGIIASFSVRNSKRLQADIQKTVSKTTPM